MKNILLTTLFLTLPAASAPAGDLILKACMQAGRSGTSTALCTCIQQVADTKLERKDQKLAASFFKDPHKAQVIRQSDRPAHEIFWARYKEFGAVAEDYCADYAG